MKTWLVPVVLAAAVSLVPAAQARQADVCCVEANVSASYGPATTTLSATWSSPGSWLCPLYVFAGYTLDSTGKVDTHGLEGVEGYVGCKFAELPGPGQGPPARAFSESPPSSWTRTGDFSRDFYVQVVFSCYWPTSLAVDRAPSPDECRGATQNGEQVFSKAVTIAVAVAPSPAETTPTSPTATTPTTPPAFPFATQFPARGIGYYSYWSPGVNWGTPQLFDVLRRSIARWRASETGATLAVGVGDMSKREGGVPPGHNLGHKRGLEVDIRPIRKDRRQGEEGRVRIDGPCVPDASSPRCPYDRGATALLIKTILDTPPPPGYKIFVLFEDTKIARVCNKPPHKDHFHVRLVELDTLRAKRWPPGAVCPPPA